MGGVEVPVRTRAGQFDPPAVVLALNIHIEKLLVSLDPHNQNRVGSDCCEDSEPGPELWVYHQNQV